eukprot:3593554-Prymnesium_polylepis.2
MPSSVASLTDKQNVSGAGRASGKAESRPARAALGRSTLSPSRRPTKSIASAEMHCKWHRHTPLPRPSPLVPAPPISALASASAAARAAASSTPDSAWRERANAVCSIISSSSIAASAARAAAEEAVSYTHLTLPTICSV